MEYGFALVAVWMLYTLFSWTLHLAASRNQGKLDLTFVERYAQQRTEALLIDFAGKGLPEMNRRQIWRRIGWIWKSTRTIALHSGRWSVAPWLALFALIGFILGLKTLFSPNSHNLRLLLGGRDFVSFLVADRRKN